MTVTSTDPFREREETREHIGDLLRVAWPVAEDLDDETRRLMLHLSIEPLATHTPTDLAPRRQTDLSLIRRVLGKKRDGSVR